MIATQPGIVARRPARWDLVHRVLRNRRARVGTVLVAVTLAIAIIGPFVAPYSPTAFVGPPYQGPSATSLFGTDSIGRDVWSRFLSGGLSIVVLSFLATMIGVGLGAVAGIAAALLRGRVDDVIMRLCDVLMAIPQIILVLLAMTTVGPQGALLVLVVGLSHCPRTARVIRGSALDITYQSYVELMLAVGESRRRLVTQEVLPNVMGPLLVEFGLRLTFSIGLIAAISFLGFGVQPPAPDWGLMINENRVGLTVQPWGVVLPIVAIALLTVGVNLVADALARVTARIDRRAAS